MTNTKSVRKNNARSLHFESLESREMLDASPLGVVNDTPAVVNSIYTNILNLYRLAKMVKVRSMLSK
ncbi:MAG: hypothetical protein LBN39_02175 [Planctomycetaceae bacterium]|jgi:hypothetical protein|nr:hypothetical protein [Planctomycetaceae bacterium]